MERAEGSMARGHSGLAEIFQQGGDVPALQPLRVLDLQDLESQLLGTSLHQGKTFTALGIGSRVRGSKRNRTVVERVLRDLACELGVQLERARQIALRVF